MYISKGLFFVLNFTRNEMNEREKRFWVFCPFFDPNTWPFLTTFSLSKALYNTKSCLLLLLLLLRTFNERNDERDDSDDDDACERKF